MAREYTRITIHDPSGNTSHVEVPPGSFIEIRPIIQYDPSEVVSVEDQININERLAEEHEAGLQSVHPVYVDQDQQDLWLNKVCGDDTFTPPYIDRSKV